MDLEKLKAAIAKLSTEYQLLLVAEPGRLMANKSTPLKVQPLDGILDNKQGCCPQCSPN